MRSPPSAPQRCLWQLCLLLVLRSAVGGLAAEDADMAPFRIAFSNRMFTDVNENDARASVMAWAKVIAKERSVPADPEARILRDTEVLPSLQAKQVDIIGLTMPEYAALQDEVRFDPVFVTEIAGRITEQYVLLTHRESRIKAPEDLAGQTLLLYQDPRASLAGLWLDTVLIEKGLKPAAQTVGKITASPKIPKAVLPVFFRQTEACVVTRSGWETMCELNPQVGKQLRIVASSTEMVPAVFALRKEYQSAFKDRLLAGIRELHRTPAGQQVLAIFRSDKLRDQPTTCLDAALALITKHQRLTAGAPAVRDSQASLSPPREGHEGSLN